MSSFGQVEIQKGKDDVVILENEVKKIPVPRNNKDFISFLSKKFDQFVKKKADTVMLMYIETDGYGVRDYALLFTKTGDSSNVFAFDKSYKTKYEILTFTLESDTLKNININNFYKTFKHDFIRSVDTVSHGYHNDVIYCKFHFGNINKILTGFANRFFYALDFFDKNFYAAWVEESNRH